MDGYKSSSIRCPCFAKGEISRYDNDEFLGRVNRRVDKAQG